MTQEDLTRLIADLIVKHQGDFSEVQADFINQIVNKPALLLAVAAPHLKGITGHAIQSVATRIAQGKLTADGRETGKSRAKSKKTADTDSQIVPEKLGLEMLKSMAIGKPARFGLEKAESIGGPRKASDTHIKAIEAIVQGNKNKH